MNKTVCLVEQFVVLRKVMFAQVSISHTEKDKKKKKCFLMSCLRFRTKLLTGLSFWAKIFWNKL